MRTFRTKILIYVSIIKMFVMLNINLPLAVHSSYYIIAAVSSRIYIAATDRRLRLYGTLLPCYIFMHAFTTTSAQNCGCKDETSGANRKMRCV